jgi:hypothetical protein
MEALYVGIDISRDKLDPALHTGESWEEEYTGPGVERLVGLNRAGIVGSPALCVDRGGVTVDSGRGTTPDAAVVSHTRLCG